MAEIQQMTTARVYRQAQQFTCAWPECGATFTAPPSDRPGSLAFCSASHAARYRESLLGHGQITLPCGTCGLPVTRSTSRLP